MLTGCSGGRSTHGETRLRPFNHGCGRDVRGSSKRVVAIEPESGSFGIMGGHSRVRGLAYAT